MPKYDLLEQSAPRAELDQRSREARLRLENVERLLMARPLPKPSLLRRVLRRLGAKIYAGQQIGGRSARTTVTRRPSRQARRVQGQEGGAAGRFGAWHHPDLHRCVPGSEDFCGFLATAKSTPSWFVPRRVSVLGTNLGTSFRA